VSGQGNPPGLEQWGRGQKLIEEGHLGPMLQPWKLAAAGALLGGVVSALLPRDTALTVQALVAAGQPQVAVLEGEIEVLRPNRFLLRDRTGAIRLETCPVWYRPLPLRPGERVRVIGELAPRSRWRMNHPVFVVHRLRRHDGPEIVLRYNQGPPPWQRQAWQANLVMSNER